VTWLVAAAVAAAGGDGSDLAFDSVSGAVPVLMSAVLTAPQQAAMPADNEVLAAEAGLQTSKPHHERTSRQDSLHIASKYFQHTSLTHNAAWIPG
jgi:hypothetical protein